MLGISVDNSLFATLLRNSSDQMGSGIYTTGQLLNTQFECNQLSYNYYGIQFGSASAISNQGIPITSPNAFNPDNVWYNNTYYPVVRLYSDTSGLSTIFKYYYDTTTTAQYNPNPFYIFSGTLSPVNNANAQNYCSNEVGPYNPHENIKTPEIRELSLGKTVRNQLVYDTLQTELTNMAREYIFQVLKSDTTIINMGDTSDYVYQAFFNTIQSSDAAHYLNAIEAMDTNNLALSQTELNMIADTNTINHNRITVGNIYLNTWANDSYDLNDDQIRALSVLAYLDPITEGDAVYTARVMLNIDPNNIENKSAIFMQNSKTDKSNAVHVYPNPTKETVTIAFDHPISNDGIVEIWNIMGSKLISSIIPKDYLEQKINVSSLTSGIYFYVIKVNKDKFASGKLIILNK